MVCGLAPKYSADSRYPLSAVTADCGPADESTVSGAYLAPHRSMGNSPKLGQNYIIYLHMFTLILKLSYFRKCLCTRYKDTFMYVIFYHYQCQSHHTFHCNSLTVVFL